MSLSDWIIKQRLKVQISSKLYDIAAQWADDKEEIDEERKRQTELTAERKTDIKQV